MSHTVLIHNESRPHQAPLQAAWCASFFCRLRGLMLRRALPERWGLLLVQSNESKLDAAIHMLFMRIDLAVVWINNAGEVVDVRLARRWRPMYAPQRAARYVLETAVERLDDYQIGDILSFERLPV